jgi:PhnB protein
MTEISTCLVFNGNCAEAMRFYEKALNGKIEMMMTNAEAPGGQVAPGSAGRIMHARLRVDGATFTAMDDMPGAPSTPNHGFWVALSYDKPSDAKRTFQALEKGAKNIAMPLQKTFWAEQFAMVVDRFGTPWMINGGMVPM